MLSSDTFRSAKGRCYPASYKAARRKEEKIYGPRLMGKLELREGATPPGEEALSLEVRFTDDGGGGHLPQRPGRERGMLSAACVVRVGRES